MFIMNFTDILATAIQNLWRNKLRTMLTILAVFIGALAISITSGVNIGVNDFLAQELEGLGAEEVLQVWKKDMGMQSTGNNDPIPYKEESSLESFIEDDLEVMLAIDGISSANLMFSELVNNIRVKNGVRYNYSTTLGIPNLNVNLLSGRNLDFDSAENEILIAERFIQALGFLNPEDAVGSEVILQVPQPDGEVQDVLATIVGVQQLSIMVGGERDGDINRSLHEEILSINRYGLPKSMTNHSLIAMVQVESVDEIPVVQESLSKIGMYSSTLEEQVSQVMGIVNAVSGGLILFGVIVLVAAVFGIMNTLYMSVQERTSEIGLMKALGLGKHKVFSIYCWEAALIGFFGSLSGLLVAIGLGTLLNNMAIDTFLSGMPEFNLVKFTLAPSIMIIVIIMLVAFLAGALPARKASKLDPITALRKE